MKKTYAKASPSLYLDREAPMVLKTLFRVTFVFVNNIKNKTIVYKMNCNYIQYGECERCKKFTDKFYVDACGCDCSSACFLCKELKMLEEKKYRKEKREKARLMFNKYHNIQSEYHFYAVTFTSTTLDPSNLRKSLTKVERSKKCSIEDYSWELTKKGFPHIHFLLKSKKYLKVRDLEGYNGGDNINVQKLKTQTDKIKWKRYINKKKTVKEKEYYIKYNIECPENPDVDVDENVDPTQ